jgi:hypothetical protein
VPRRYYKSVCDQLWFIPSGQMLSARATSCLAWISLHRDRFGDFIGSGAGRAISVGDLHGTVTSIVAELIKYHQRNLMRGVSPLWSSRIGALRLRIATGILECPIMEYHIWLWRRFPSNCLPCGEDQQLHVRAYRDNMQRCLGVGQLPESSGSATSRTSPLRMRSFIVCALSNTARPKRPA